MRALRWGLPVLLAGTLAACSSGSSVTCSFDDPAGLAASSPWPKFHHDQQNTGTVVNANVASNPGTCLWVFPPGGTDSCSNAVSTPAKGAFTASPVISGDGKRIYIGSADGTLYALEAADGTQVASTDFGFSIARPITSTALVAARPVEGEVVFVGAGDGTLYGLTNTGATQPTYWPSALGGFISGSPNIGADGTVYVTSVNGIFAGVCPNGVDRFASSTVGSQSSPARGPDGTLYFGTDDGELHAVQLTGTTSWSFSAAGPILTAPVFDTDTNSIYVADRSGRVFKIGTNGRPDPSFTFGPVAPIYSSPALAEDHLYFGSDDGNVYAVDKHTGNNKTTGKPDWAFLTGSAVRSSPAVATNPGSPAIVVIGSDDGDVYFLQDNGTSVTLMAAFSIGAPVRSSPAIGTAIGSDGTVYVGANDGRVYAIGAPLPTPTPSS